MNVEENNQSGHQKSPFFNGSHSLKKIGTQNQFIEKKSLHQIKIILFLSSLIKSLFAHDGFFE